MEITEALQQLRVKDNKVAYQALEYLEQASQMDDHVYQHFAELASLLEHPHSYVRTRGLLLIAANIQWDAQGQFDAIAENYCQHIMDAKAITARQCLQSLCRIIPYKPHLQPLFVKMLRDADFSGYADSMQPVLEKDRAAAFALLDRTADH